MATKSPDESRKAYLRRRDARIDELYFSEGLEPRDIATRMLREETLGSVSDESAVRTVRGVVAKLRKRIESERVEDGQITVALTRADSLEREISRLRFEHQRQVRIADGEPDSSGKEATITSSVDTPQGMITSVRPKWPAGVRQKASRDAATLAQKISKLEADLTDLRFNELEKGKDGAADGGLTIIESDKSIPELIVKNLSVN